MTLWDNAGTGVGDAAYVVEVGIGIDTENFASVGKDERQWAVFEFNIQSPGSTVLARYGAPAFDWVLENEFVFIRSRLSSSAFLKSLL